MNPRTAYSEERLARDLEFAVDRGEILAHYQPQIDTVTGLVVAVEALCRWRHPELGSIAPDVFVPIAEETGSIHSIGRFMIEDGCRLAADWQRAGLPIEVAVNVSATQLAPGFFGHLDEFHAREGIGPGRLTIEITESQMITDVEAAVRDLAKVRALGVGISVDDFGTGHSTVEQVINLPVTELKIDQAIVQEEGEAGQRAMNAIVDLVHRRGLRVVAEGVETEQQMERVRRLHCDRVQGYLIAPPLPRLEVEDFIAGRNAAV
ncbi:EAL domain-containing protein [Leifsonia sp. YIM 134122]|uniref:EAL domain-containing protein n=1 Tax=Leifsonia stereocauli TaxID=3134136 RepID=A0ABU9VZB7_9MICO